MDAKFIQPSRREYVWFNLNQVYKIEKNGTNVTFYFPNGESFEMNSGLVPDEIKKVLEG
jgi:hypothetical protein